MTITSYTHHHITYCWGVCFYYSAIKICSIHVVDVLTYVYLLCPFAYLPIQCQLKPYSYNYVRMLFMEPQCATISSFHLHAEKSNIGCLTSYNIHMYAMCVYVYDVYMYANVTCNYYMRLREW